MEKIENKSSSEFSIGVPDNPGAEGFACLMRRGVSVFECLDFIEDDKVKGALFQNIPISSGNSIGGENNPLLKRCFQVAVGSVIEGEPKVRIKPVDLVGPVQQHRRRADDENWG